MPIQTTYTSARANLAKLCKEVAENREIGDATTLADSSVMDLIAAKLPSAASED